MLFKQIGRQLHDKDRAYIAKQRGRAAEYTAFEPINIEFDELHVPIGKFAQYAVETARPCGLCAHFTAEVFGMQPGCPGERPARINGGRHLVGVSCGQKTVASGDSVREPGIKFKITAELAEGKLRRLEGDDPAVWANELGQMESVSSDIGSNIEH